MKRALLVITVLAALGGIFAASMLRGNGSGRGVEARAEAVERRAIRHLVKASGQIDPRVKVNVSAHVVARIEKIHARDGEEVRAGQPFIELEKETFRAARDRAAAQLAMAETAVRQAAIDLEDAELKLRRAERLKTEKIFTDEQLEAAELAARSARLRVEQSRESVTQSRADLDKATDDLQKTTIHAPISGRVIVLNAEEGEVVVSGTMHNEASVIAVVADLSEILVEVLADETDIVQVALGQPAEVAVDALHGVVYTGKVVEIGNAGVSLTTQPEVTFFRVKVLLDRPDARLLAGMSARASIEVAGLPDALVVPIEAVVYRPPVSERARAAGSAGGRSEGPAAAASSAESSAERSRTGSSDEVQVVFVVGADGTVEQRPVAIGIADVTHVQIEGGLEEGEQVVTGPQRVLEDLEPGARVRVTTGAPTDEAPGGGVVVRF